MQKKLFFLSITILVISASLNIGLSKKIFAARPDHTPSPSHLQQPSKSVSQENPLWDYKILSHAPPRINGILDFRHIEAEIDRLTLLGYELHSIESLSTLDGTDQGAGLSVRGRSDIVVVISCFTNSSNLLVL